MSNRSSDAEYLYSDFFLTQLTYDVGVIERGMQIRGVYDVNNYDADGITDLMKIERGGHTFQKSDKTWWRKYNFITPLNLGLARDGKILPSGIPYRYFKILKLQQYNNIF